MDNYCINCYTNMGKYNPRQLCYKTFCPLTLPKDKEDIDENRKQQLRDYNKKYYKIIQKSIEKYKITMCPKYLRLIKKYDKKILKNVREVIKN